MVYALSSGLMLNMYKYGSNSKQIDKNEIFASISVTLGGNGKEITRTQLKNYINKAENGEIRTGQKQLRACKQLDAVWDDLYGKNKESITVDDMPKAIGLFTTMLIDKTNEDDSTSFIKKSNEKIKKYIDEISKKINGIESKIATKSQLKDYLAKLIDENSDEIDNDEDIAKVTNLLAEMSEQKTTEYDA